MRIVKVALSVCLALAVAAPAFAADAFILIPGMSGDSTHSKRKGWSDVEAETLFVAPGVAQKGKSTEVRCSTTVSGFLGAGASSALPLVGSPLSGNVVIEIETSSGTGAPQLLSRATLGGAVIESMARSFPTLSHELQISFSTIDLTTWTPSGKGSYTEQAARFDCTRP